MEFILLHQGELTFRIFIPYNVKEEFGGFFRFVCAWGDYDRTIQYERPTSLYSNFYGYEISNDIKKDVLNILKQQNFKNITVQYLRDQNIT